MNLGQKKLYVKAVRLLNKAMYIECDDFAATKGTFDEVFPLKKEAYAILAQLKEEGVTPPGIYTSAANKIVDEIEQLERKQLLSIRVVATQ